MPSPPRSGTQRDAVRWREHGGDRVGSTRRGSPRPTSISCGFATIVSSSGRGRFPAMRRGSSSIISSQICASPASAAIRCALRYAAMNSYSLSDSFNESTVGSLPRARACEVRRDERLVAALVDLGGHHSVGVEEGGEEGCVRMGDAVDEWRQLRLGLLGASYLVGVAANDHRLELDHIGRDRAEVEARLPHDLLVHLRVELLHRGQEERLPSFSIAIRRAPSSSHADSAAYSDDSRFSTAKWSVTKPSRMKCFFARSACAAPAGTPRARRRLRHLGGGRHTRLVRRRHLELRESQRWTLGERLALRRRRRVAARRRRGLPPSLQQCEPQLDEGDVERRCRLLVRLAQLARWRRRRRRRRPSASPFPVR